MGRIPALAAAVACLAAAAYLALHAGDEAKVRDAALLGAAGRYDAALARVDGLTREPSATRAWRIRAAALVGAGRVPEAEHAFAEAARRAPRDWTLRRDWALVRLSAGDRRGAARQMRLALALNPRLHLPPGFTAG
jgi:tetratricopeptide (TPR) repeat protein